MQTLGSLAAAAAAAVVRASSCTAAAAAVGWRGRGCLCGMSLGGI